MKRYTISVPVSAMWDYTLRCYQYNTIKSNRGHHPGKMELINNRNFPIQDEYNDKYLAEKKLDLTATLATENANGSA